MRKIKYKLEFLFSFLFFVISAHSQTAKISGKVLDAETKEAIEYANVVLLSVDSVFINGTTTNEMGVFSIDSSNKRFILQTSLIGYDTEIANYDLEKENTDNIEIFLRKSSLELNEVTVTASLPQFKLENGNLITNVNNTLLSTIGTANDVLGKIPGVSANDNNEVTVFGKGSPLIYIDNRKIFDRQELSQLQSKDILSVELIKNPGAKYDAENRSVIIIKTKKKPSGFSLNVYDRIQFGNYIGNTESIRLTFSKKKFNFYASYYNVYAKNKTDESSLYTIYSDTIWNQAINQPYIYKEKDHTVSTSFDFTLSPQHVIGAQYNGMFSSDKNHLYGDQNFSQNNTLIENIDNSTLQKQKPRTNLFNAYYNGQFSDRLTLQLVMDYVNKKSSVNQQTNEVSSIPGNDLSLKINSESDFNLFASKLISTYKISDNSSLDVGVEYNTIKGNGYYINSEFVNMNNLYTNNEDKAAGFASYQKEINGWDLGIGLRYEYSKEKMTEDSAKNVTVDKNYNSIYPNLSASKQFGGVNMSLAANKRVSRPSFSDLNSNDLYINRFFTQKGNPYLKNEDYYEINYNLQYKIFSLSAGYSYVKNPIFFEFIEDGNSSANSLLTYKNYDKYQRINAVATVDYSTRFWKPQLTVSFGQPFFKMKYLNKIINQNKSYLGINFYNDFILPQNYTVSLYYSYEKGYNEYIAKWDGSTEIDARFRKSFFDKKLYVNLYINDIFNMKRERTSSYIDNFAFIDKKKRETQYVSLTVQYLFNTTNKKYGGKNASPDDINRL